ncbi:MAG: glycosyltransferase family 4 protein [Actinobacteria bacterium]|nr:glycosyltransferase family 4 protein [Actinomycetota bacterium]
MRIGVIASIAHRLPPRGYGPWEQIASTLTEGFVARGHDVTLFATADSLTTANLHGTAPTGYEEDREQDAKVAEALHIAAAFERAPEFDVLANHFDFLPLTYSRLVRTPVVTTIHGFSSERIVPVFRAYDDIGHFVSISDADRHPDLHYAATIHHGIDTTQFTFSPTVGAYLLFLGRIHPDKGTDLAIEIARLAGMPLIIAGIVQDEAYYRDVVSPLIDGVRVTYVGPVGPAERDVLLGGAAALLHPIRFAEPFGLSVVESLATGTPVIAYPLGSMPELLEDGATGFLVDDVDAAVQSVAKISEIDRAHCRAVAETRFSADRMIDDYLGLFARILDESPARPSA